MLNICIVEDDLSNTKLLSEYVERFCKEQGISFHIDSFTDGLDFLASYRPVYILIFMDIQLPSISGMDAAHRLREIDGHVSIIFVTNLLKYAIHGYEVQAFDYIVKPIHYFDFSARMKKFLKQIFREEEPAVLLPSGGQLQRIEIRDISYVEVVGHNLRYHAVGEEYTVKGSLVSAEQRLPSEYFVKCNSGILVNLNYVQALEKDRVKVAGDWLPVSRPKRKEFSETVARFISKR